MLEFDHSSDPSVTRFRLGSSRTINPGIDIPAVLTMTSNGQGCILYISPACGCHTTIRPMRDLVILSDCHGSYGVGAALTPTSPGHRRAMLDRLICKQRTMACVSLPGDHRHPALTVITPNTIVETSSLRDLISITIFSTKDATRLHSHNPYLQGSGHNITYPPLWPVNPLRPVVPVKTRGHSSSAMARDDHTLKQPRPR